MRLLLLSIAWIAFSGYGVAQNNGDDDDASGGVSLGAHTATSVSYIGWSQNFSGEFNLGGHRLYIGPGLSISDAYMPWKSSYTANLGYRYVFELDGNWISSAGIHTQMLTGKQPGGERARTFEGFLQYGFGLEIGDLYILNTMGFGGYLERFYNYGFGEYTVLHGYNYQIMLTIGYDF